MLRGVCLVTDSKKSNICEKSINIDSRGQNKLKSAHTTIVKALHVTEVNAERESKHQNQIKY